MNNYQYIDKDNQTQTIQAGSPEEAMKTASGIGTTSGVRLLKDTAPTATPESPSDTPESTIGDTYGGLLNKPTLTTGGATNTVDTDKIRRNTLKEFQAEINTVNDIFADRLNRARNIGGERLGSERAMSARGGLLGSDFGEAQRSKVVNLNEADAQRVESEKLAAIGAVMANARSTAESRVANALGQQRLANETQDSYAKRQVEEKQRLVDNLSAALYSKNLSFEDLSMDQVNQLSQDYGVSVSDLLASYQNYTNKLTPKTSTGFSLSEGQRRFEIDPVTGGFKEVGFNPKTYSPSTGMTNMNQMTDNERALFGQFRGEPIVKNYNEVVNKKLSVDQIVANGVGGPADLALVFEFMKALDPTSVVRESEYDTAAKSGNIFRGIYAQFNGYLSPEGGFLPPEVRQNFNQLTNMKLQVAQRLYDNLASQYSDIATRQGLNPQNVVLGYGDVMNNYEVPAGAAGAEAALTLVGPDGTLFDASQLTPEELQEALAAGYRQQ
jgi:hypothetical protein